MDNLISLQPLRLDTCDRVSLLHYFQNSWQLEDLLLKSLISDDTFYHSPDPLRNPLIFYLGHSAVFYINKLIQVDLLKTRLNPDYERLFEIGVDPATPEELHAATAAIQWPEVESVWQYRDRVYETIANLINTAAFDLPITQDSPWWALMMGIEHSRIHFETSSMLIRQFPIDRLQRPQDWQYAPTTGTVPDNTLVPMSGGIVNLGKSQNSATYGWDIEYGHQQVATRPFLASRYLISNGEFLSFVQDQGYENPDYWQAESWEWKVRNQVQHPKFWLVDKDTYQYRAMFNEIDLPLDWPVEVNHYEAMAFCTWKGNHTRLMTESEWRLAHGNALDNHPPTESNTTESNILDDRGYNLNLKWGSPSPVDWQSTAQCETGLHDLRGNVWEWLGERFKPLPGFCPHPLYQDYSEPFFDDHHRLMMGGAWASTGTYAAKDCRNWFRKNFYQHAGFRIAQPVD